MARRPYVAVCAGRPRAAPLSRRRRSLATLRGQLTRQCQRRRPRLFASPTWGRNGHISARSRQPSAGGSTAA
eukprot:4194814-Pyramimonas_sp.AAC.1